MNKRIKRLWVKALRSGRYNQGTGRLRNDDKFCCLGVLCDLHAKQTGSTWQINNLGIYEYGGADSVLPGTVASWSEINDDNPRLGRNSNSLSAAEFNDAGKDFNCIADRIEKYL